MSYFEKFQTTFEKGSRPFVKWSLSPVLVLFSVLIFSQAITSYHESRPVGVAACLIADVTAICSLLAIWGVKHAGRVVTGIIGGVSVYYVLDQWVFDFPGYVGLSSRRSSTTPLNSLLAFFAFGFPCLVYTIFGRPTIRKPKPDPTFEILCLTFMLDDEKRGSFELRNRLRKLVNFISEHVCDGIIAGDDGENDEEDGKFAIRFWSIDAEEFIAKIRAELPDEPLLASCTWIRMDASGSETPIPNPYLSMD